ncbi:hypothetical protein EDB87DRAFT_1581034 [Lactarius vividus]|nr:hypothetical protein EDB87DRAFT_1581034 [Lactarius vividus]
MPGVARCYRSTFVPMTRASHLTPPHAVYRVQLRRLWKGVWDRKRYFGRPLGSEGYYLLRSLYGRDRCLSLWCYVSWCRSISDSAFVTLSLAPLSLVSTLVDCLSSGHEWQEATFPFMWLWLTPLYHQWRSHWDILSVWLVNWDAGTCLDSLDSVTVRRTVVDISKIYGYTGATPTLGHTILYITTFFSVIFTESSRSYRTCAIIRLKCSPAHAGCRSTHPSARRALFQGAIGRALLWRLYSIEWSTVSPLPLARVDVPESRRCILSPNLLIWYGFVHTQRGPLRVPKSAQGDLQLLACGTTIGTSFTDSVLLSVHMDFGVFVNPIESDCCRPRSAVND